MKRVGILGGGQLGMLLAKSVHKLGARTVVYDPDDQAPACYQAKNSINCAWLNYEAMETFFGLSDVVTYEFENVESAALTTLERLKPVMPSVKVLKATQDRVSEKKFLLANGLPHANFVSADSVGQLRALVDHVNYPSIVKTARGGYDGKGQFLAYDRFAFLGHIEDPNNYWIETFSGVVEERIEIATEVSVIVARAPSGDEVAFPVLENIHQDHILDMTILPARVPDSVQLRLQEIALDAARKMEVYGLLTTEFFLARTPNPNSIGIECDGWYIYINEFAPRPHNSGHVTMNACCMSQFDALARILLGHPLTQPWIVAPGTFCMMNLLGDVWLAQNGGNSDELDLSVLRHHHQVIDVVLYGKREPRAKRKMGHFVTYGPSAENAIDAAMAFRKSLLATVASEKVAQ